MTRRMLQILIPVLILLSLASSATSVAGESGLVGVRIPAGSGIDRQRVREGSQVMIDYGSFTWTLMSPAGLADLDAAGVAYQEFPDPYALTLGGQTFDPLLSPPVFTPDWLRAGTPGEPGLHLIQFPGPTKSEWLDSLVAGGLDVVQYIHPFTYVVWGDATALASQNGKDFIRWAGDYLPAYAVQPLDRSLGRELTSFRILVYPGEGLADIIPAIESLGGSMVSVQSHLDPSFDLINCTLPGNQIQEAAALPGVYSIQPVPVDGGNRGEMSNQVSAGNTDGSNRAFTGYQAWLSSLNLSGQDVIIAHVDDGLDQEHPDLVARILPCSGSTCGGELAGAHGTHTAGIMTGDGSSGARDSFGFLRGLGMAPGANLVEQLYSPTYADAGGMLTLMTESYRNQALISGNSWGPSGTPLGYDADTRWVDIGVRDADPEAEGDQPLVYVLSIMNGYGGISSQGTPDEAKNALTVGSTMMQYGDGRQNLNINHLSANTAHGPALDGRLIPHLVAPGCYVDSTYNPDSGHFLRCGTSMASPHVSGAVALFFEMYRGRFNLDPSPALVKAAFLPAAHDLAGNRDANGGIMGHPFDTKQGWGRMDVDKVLNPLGEALYFDQQIIFDETGQSWSLDLNLSTTIQSLKAMLVWTDAPGHGLGGSTPAWVNDLDLSIEIGSQTYYGNNFGTDGLSVPGGSPDDRNNTEGIFLGAVPEGVYSLTVTASQISGDGVPGFGGATDQDFALVVYLDRNGGEETLYEVVFPLFFR